MLDALGGANIAPGFRNFLADQGSRFEAMSFLNELIGGAMPAGQDRVSTLQGYLTDATGGGALTGAGGLRALVDQFFNKAGQGDSLFDTLIQSRNMDQPSEILELVASVLSPTMSRPFLQALLDQGTGANLDAQYRQQAARQDFTGSHVQFLQALGLLGAPPTAVAAPATEGPGALPNMNFPTPRRGFGLRGNPLA